MILPLLSGTGGHALRSLPTQNLSPLVSPSEGELAAPLSTAPTLDGLGPPSSSCASPAPPPPLKDNPSLAEFVPMLTQGWAEIFIRRPSGTGTVLAIRSLRAVVGFLFRYWCCICYSSPVKHHLILLKQIKDNSPSTFFAAVFKMDRSLTLFLWSQVTRAG